MMKVQILGTGCDKCRKLTENAKSAVAAAGLECTVEKIEDLDRILEMGAMITPALAIDGKIVSSGRVLSPEAIGEHLRKAGVGPTAEGEPVSVPAEGGCCCGGACGDEAKPVPAAPACSCGGACEPKPAPGADSEEACGCGCCGHGGGSSFARTLVTVILLIFVIGSLAVMALRERGEAQAAAESPASADTAAAAPAAVPADTVAVTYFHGSKRCKTCMAIESQTKAAVEAVFASEIAAGRVLFRSVNIEEAANAHFVRDYGLTFSTVVVSRGDTHERLDNVWQLIRGTPEAFARNITDAVRRVEAR